MRPRKSSRRIRRPLDRRSAATCRQPADTQSARRSQSPSSGRHDRRDRTSGSRQKESPARPRPARLHGRPGRSRAPVAPEECNATKGLAGPGIDGTIPMATRRSRAPVAPDECNATISIRARVLAGSLLPRRSTSSTGRCLGCRRRPPWVRRWWRVERCSIRWGSDLRTGARAAGCRSRTSSISPG